MIIVTVQKLQGLSCNISCKFYLLKCGQWDKTHKTMKQAIDNLKLKDAIGVVLMLCRPFKIAKFYVYEW